MSIRLLSKCGCALLVFSLYPAFIANAADNPIQSGFGQQLRRIGIAMHQYYEKHGAFPFAGDKDGAVGTGLSWRVHILPYLGERALYEEFDLNQPWDSPHNRSLAAQIPEVYKAPYIELVEGTTIYLGVATPTESILWNQRKSETFFHRQGRTRRINQITDGTRYTIMIVAADPSEAVIWTKPADWEFDPDAPRRGLGSNNLSGFLVLFADGSPGVIPYSIADDTLRRLFWINDGEQVIGYTPPAYEEKDVRP